MKRKKILNSLKTTNIKIVHKIYRDFNFIKIFKRNSIKKNEFVKKFYRLTNIGRFFFKCNAEFFNHKHQLFNIKVFFNFIKFYKMIENIFFKNFLSKFYLSFPYFFNIIKFISRKNILFNQIDNNELQLIFLIVNKWFFLTFNNSTILPDFKIVSDINILALIWNSFSQNFFLFSTIIYYFYFIQDNRITYNLHNYDRNYYFIFNFYKIHHQYLFVK